ncbi:hypothetical protein, partial [Klebsiella michiganensis]|uniref:hypothetical protein n=1 Tax=Klebsiella michiganensis TaxID=1134687 RepID=UPI001C54D62A
PPGKVRCRMPCCGFLPGGAALTGLRVHNRLRIGSPDRRNAPPPGKVRCLVPCCGFLPGGAALSRATGSQPSADR